MNFERTKNHIKMVLNLLSVLKGHRILKVLNSKLFLKT